MDFAIIYDELKKRKITQKEMCKDIGIGEPSLSNIKNGTKTAGIEMVLKISKYLNIDPAVLSPEHKDLFPEYSINTKDIERVVLDQLDVNDFKKIINSNSYLSYATKELSTSVKELSISAKESNIALVELTKKIIDLIYNK